MGAQYENQDGSDRKFEILLCAPGDPVELRPEPKNKHDERAIAVFSERGVQIGYLTAERCGRIGALIREGRELVAVFQVATGVGAWIRVSFDGTVPQLPAPQPAPAEGADPEPDFYPDEVWDE